jgi:hypothetical protein
MDPKTLEMLTKLIPAGMPPEQAAKILEEFGKDASMNRNLGKLGAATRAVPWLMVMQEAASSTPANEGEDAEIMKLLSAHMGPQELVGPKPAPAAAPSLDELDQLIERLTGPKAPAKAAAAVEPAVLSPKSQAAIDRVKAELPLSAEAQGSLAKIKAMSRQEDAAAKKQADAEALENALYETNKAFERVDPKSKAEAEAHERKQKMKKSIRSIQDLRELQK